MDLATGPDGVERRPASVAMKMATVDSILSELPLRFHSA
jgi:hypothetical protein